MSRTSVIESSKRAKLSDKQSERDHRELRIDKVGVRGLRFPIQVRDKAHAVQNTVAQRVFAREGFRSTMLEMAMEL